VDPPILLGIDERSAALWLNGTWHAQGSGGVTLIRGDREARFGPGDTIDGLPTPLG
jgi:hypothetical protein